MNTVDATPRPQLVARGIALIVAAMFVTSVQDVVFKLFTDDLVLGQVFALRALLAFPLIYALARSSNLPRGALAAALRPWLVLRSACMTLMFLAFYAAIPFVDLSTLGAGAFLSPIFVALLSAYVAREPVRYLGWIAVLMGFLGVLLLLQPGTETFSSWAVLPVIGALFYASGHVITRTKCQSVPLATMALSLNLIMMTAGLCVSVMLFIWPASDELSRAYPFVFGQWQSVGLSEWLVLATLAALAVTISLGIAGAYQAAPSPIVATFEYSYLLFVAMWDALIFASQPGSLQILGMLMIAGAGMMVMRRT